MLRIKDNVDLKELEKYGFEYNFEFNKYRYMIPSSEEWLEILANKEIHLYIGDEYYCCWTSCNSFDKLYDLIQDGLVERVNDSHEI